MPRPRRARTALLLTIGAAAWLALATPPAAVAADDEPGGAAGIVIDVQDDAPTPTPSPSGSGGGATPGTQRSQGGSGGPGGSGSQPGQGSQNPSSELVSSLPGTPVALAVGGISASVTPTFAVDGGSATLSVVVRNTSAETFDAAARFVVTDLFGTTIGEEDGIPVGPLEPDVARTVSVTFDGLGQNVFVRSSVKITPPQKVGDTDLSPVTRDALVFVPPLFALSVIAAAAALGWASWWAIGRARRDALDASPLAKARV